MWTAFSRRKRFFRDTLKIMRTAYIGMGGNLASWEGTARITQ
jgi:hypothetical protein